MKILFLVPKGYSSVGGLYLPIMHYEEFFVKKNYKVIIFEIPYHKDSSLRKVKSKIDEEISKEDCYIIGFTLNICYIMVHEFHLYKYNNDHMVVFLVDSMTLNMKSVLKDEKFGITRLKHLLRLYVYTHKEKYCLKKGKKIVYVSSVDKSFVERYFSQQKNGTIYSIPNGTDIMPPAEYKKDCRETQLVLGTLTGFSKETLENNLFPFLTTIFPEILKVFPDIRLIIAGRGANIETIEKFKSMRNIEYIGEVKELIDFYKEVDIVITTVKKECGIINRILEAWSYSKINIGYKRNFVAFDKAENNQHYIAADDPNDYIMAIQRLENDTLFARKIASQGYELVKTNYTWNNSGEKLLAALENTVK